MKLNREQVIQWEHENQIAFSDKLDLVPLNGKGVWVYDMNGKKYLDFTSGWGVTALGHASPVIRKALCGQSRKIIQNPNSGLSYSPARSECLSELIPILPEGLSRVFFTNSGAEANDAALKLARKVNGRQKVVSAEMSFHGRTLATLSATGQLSQREKFTPRVTDHVYVPFGDLETLERELKSGDIAAVLLEPIQGEGGVIVPPATYLKSACVLARKYGALFIADEVQTGFYRTGKPFGCDWEGVSPDMMTMAKGIAGGFPFGAFAVTEAVASKLSKGDHGGTYAGNPLGCAVSAAVIHEMKKQKIGERVEALGRLSMEILGGLMKKHPAQFRALRGRGLLIALEVCDEAFAKKLEAEAFRRGLLLNRKHGVVFRFFPALTISAKELTSGYRTFEEAVNALQ